MQIAQQGDGVAVRARAPLRLGLAGGGTDLSPYCNKYGGAVLNATVDRYAHAYLRAGDGILRFDAIDYKASESFSSADELPKAELILHRAVHERFVREFVGHWVDLTVTTSVESPPGSGLGSSSALVVALVEAYRAYFQLPLGPYDVARLAYEIERIDLALEGGRQDQYAAAFGGVNFIEFLPDDRVIVNPLRVPAHVLNELESSMVICFSGVSRESRNIIVAQQRGLANNDRDALEGMHTLKAEALNMKTAILAGDLCEMARILNRSAEAKQRTATGIQTDAVSEFQRIGLRHGALATKISGRRWRLYHVLDRAGKPAATDRRLERQRRAGFSRQVCREGGRILAPTGKFVVGGGFDWSSDPMGVCGWPWLVTKLQFCAVVWGRGSAP